MYFVLTEECPEPDSLSYQGEDETTGGGGKTRSEAEDIYFQST